MLSKLHFCRAIKLLNYQVIKLNFYLFKGNDELFFITQFNCVLDYNLKKKLLSSNNDLKLIYELSMKTRSEENFWKEFLKNQKNSKTEIFGGLDNLSFTAEEKKMIENKNNLNNNSNNILPGSNTKLTANSSNNNSIFTIKKFENLEKHKLYLPKYYGSNLSVAEFNFNDKEILQNEDFNKKEINSFIEKINNYSIRKLDSCVYIDSFNYERQMRKNLNNKKQVAINLNNLNFNINNNNNLTTNKAEENTIFNDNNQLKTKNHSLKEKLNIMKQENSNKEMQLKKIKAESVEVFKKVINFIVF